MERKTVLPNGIKVITEAVTYVQSVSIGIWAASGARDEGSANMGISHFIEHMLFKGTEKRTARDIADEFDTLGGHLNAFTEKEYTCYYSKVLSEHASVAIDILSDMFLNSVFDPKELELEKSVVYEEIKRYEDTPDDLVHDMFVQTVWGGHPLGNPIIGTWDSVSKLTPDDIREYMRTRYTPDSIIITAAGNLEHEAIVEQINRLFGHLKGKKTMAQESKPVFLNESRMDNKKSEQVHMCIGTHGFSHLEEERYALALIDATLGGGMSSRLFQEIREKRGLVYAIGSYGASYREGGFFTVYCGTSPQNLGEVKELILKEFANIRKDNMTEQELIRAKNQIRGALVLSQEGMSSRMIRMAKSEIYFGRVVPIDEIIKSVMNVTHKDIASVAERIFGGDEYPIVAIGPFKSKRNGKTHE